MSRFTLGPISCFLIVALFCHCQPPVPDNQPAFEANIYVRYLAPEVELMGQASFQLVDTSTQQSQPLTFPGGVAFMGSGMELQSLPGQPARYTSTLQTAYVSPFRFSFTLPEDEQVTELELAMSPIEEFSVTQASQEEGLRLELDGSLLPEETLLLFFTDEAQQSRTIERLGPLEGTTLFIPASGLANLSSGAQRLYLVKKKTARVQQGNRTIYQTLEYYSKEIELALE